MKPTFSIIIPAYNVDAYIEMTLKSVYNQTFADYEIIVIDDGSTDKTLEILHKQTDSRLRVIHQKNAGVSAARNVGISAAKGKYIAFLDADDAWTNDHLALAHLFFSRHTEYVWYCSAYTRPYEITEEMLYNTPSRNKAQFETRNWVLEIANTFACAGVVILRSAITDEKLFPEGVIMAEDAIGLMKIAIKHPIIGYLNSETLLYRRRAESASHTFSRDPEHYTLEALNLTYYKQLVKLSSYSTDVQLYETFVSLHSWWNRIRAMCQIPMITNLAKRKHILGSFTTIWLLSCLYICGFLCMVIGKFVMIARNSIKKKMKRRALNQRKKLSSIYEAPNCETVLF